MYIPDQLIRKKRASLISALGHVKQVQGRTVTIKLSNGYIVKQHCTDLIQFEVNPNFESNLDLLNLPIYGSPVSDSFILDESQFRDLSTGAFYIPTVSDDQVYHGKDVQVMSDSEVESPQENDKSAPIDCGKPVAAANDNVEPLRRSSRVPKPTMKFLQNC